jgi:hypothetical protein
MAPANEKHSRGTSFPLSGSLAERFRYSNFKVRNGQTHALPAIFGDQKHLPGNGYDIISRKPGCKILSF